jgi:peroxiredoxin
VNDLQRRLIDLQERPMQLLFGPSWNRARRQITPACLTVVVLFCLISATFPASNDPGPRQPAQPKSAAPTLGETRVDEEANALARLKQAGAHIDSRPGTPIFISIFRKTNDATLQLLRKLPHLTVLTLAHESVTDGHLKYLHDLSSLESLDVRSPHVGDAGLAVLGGLPRLKNLSLFGTQLTDDGLASLARLTKLRSLHISSERLTGAGLKHLSGLPGLQELDLAGGGLRDAELAPISKLLALKSLDLHGDHITDAAVAHLKSLRGLKDLRLNGTKISDEGMAALTVALPGCKIIGGSMAAGQENLNKIGMALHEYHSEHGHFPPAVLLGPDGKTHYSWRVALLPYLGEQSLFAQYLRDQPWDSPENVKVLERMPDVYRAPKLPVGTHDTSYFAVTGPKTVFPDNAGISISQIPDGTANVILVVETRRSVPWTKPADIAYDADGPLPEFGGFHKAGFNATMGDGSARFIEFPPKEEEQIRFLLSKSWIPDRRREIAAALIGRPAPDFTLRDLAGEEISVSNLIRGKVALIAFSAVGCAPCCVEAPHLTELDNKHKADGLIVVTVNPWDEPEEVVRKYVAREKLTNVFLLDGKAVAREKYHLRWYPTTCVVNHKGIVVSVKTGFEPGDEQTLTRQIDELLAARRATKPDDPPPPPSR